MSTQTQELKEAVQELFSPTEWKDTLKHIHNDVEAVRHLSVFGYAIFLCVGMIAGIVLAVNLG
jgi:hypothetical protein